MNLKQLVASGKIEQAIELLISNGLDENRGILLLSQYNQLKQYEMARTLRTSEINIGRNRIVQSILSVGSDLNLVGETGSSEVILSNQELSETALLSIIGKNGRRREHIKEEANRLLVDYRAYLDKKRMKSTFDRANRRLVILQNRFMMLQNELKEKKADAIEAISEELEQLLEGVPSYKKLDKAYKLVSGRGFSNSWIKEQLENRPNDDETKISIAELIEDYAGKIAMN